MFAWPTTTVAVTGALAAERILHRRLLAEVAGEDRTQVENELAVEHEVRSGGLDG